MNKKGKFELGKWVMSLLVFTVVVITFVLMLGNLNVNYDNVNMDNSSFDGLTNTTTELYQYSTGLKNSSVTGGVVDEQSTEDSMFRAGYTTLKLLTGTFSIAANTVNIVATEIGIPGYFVTFAMMTILILVSFGVLYMIFRFRG